MHGLEGKAIEGFLRDVYGEAAWRAVASAAAAPADGFEAMLAYPEGLRDALLAAAACALGKPREALLSDLGLHLVSHPSREGLRRLLRFAGSDFPGFLHSLEDLPERARLAVADLGLPRIELRPLAPDHYEIECTGAPPGFGHMLCGALAAMADDYGALALIEHAGRCGAAERISVRIAAEGFAPGRAFHLARALP